MHPPQSHHPRSSRRRSSNLASCMVATVFLLLIITAAVTVFFVFFKPKQPKIAVEAVQFPTFSLSNGTLNFTCLQDVSVTNPNRDDFTHYDSSLQLVYSGSPVGLVFIPAGQIGGGRTQHMMAKFDVQSYTLPATAMETAVNYDGGGGDPAMMEIETRMKMIGRVRVLKIFSHRVESNAVCRVAIDASKGGSILGFHC